MNVSIVIPTWRGRDLLRAYLPSVVAATDFYRRHQGFQSEIIIVDDASGDDTISWLKQDYGERVRIVQHCRNLGFCAACWTGFKQARFPIVLLLNNDVRLEENCIAPLVEHFADARVFAVTGKMYNQKGDVFCNGGKIGRFRRGMWSSYENYDVLPSAQTHTELLSFAAIAAFSAYDRDKFLKIGGFEPMTAMYEDIEISYRAWKYGWLIKYEPRSVAFHDAGQTMARRYRRRSREVLARRSRLWMHWLLLHDHDLFGWHIATLAARFFASWIYLDWPFYWALATGFANLPAILRKRRENRRNTVCSDRELIDLLEHFYQTGPIFRRNE